MSADFRPTKRKRIFYGWWIVACGTVVMALQSGLYWYGFSVYFAPLKDEFGWTATALSAAFAVGRLESGIVFLAAGLPVALIIRHRPEPYGYLPDDASPQSDEGKAECPAEGERRQGQAWEAGARKVAAAEIGEEVSFSPKQAIVTSSFWLIALVFTVRQVITNGVAIHQIPALVNVGYSPGVAAGVLAITTTLSVPGRLIFGWLGDRWDKRYAIAVCLVMQLLGLYAFAYAGDTLMLMVFLVLYSPAYGAFLPLMPATWGDFFGRKRFATISGLAQMITMWGTIAGPLLAGYAFDVSGSYQWAILFFAIVNTPALFFLLSVRRPRLKPIAQIAPT